MPHSLLCHHLFLLCIWFIEPGSFLSLPPQENTSIGYFSPLLCQSFSMTDMQRIIDNSTQVICPSFEDPRWEFLRWTMVNSHQGNQPLMMEEAAQQMKDMWTCENQLKVDVWNIHVTIQSHSLLHTDILDCIFLFSPFVMIPVCGLIFFFFLSSSHSLLFRCSHCSHFRLLLLAHTCWLRLCYCDSS